MCLTQIRPPCGFINSERYLCALCSLLSYDLDVYTHRVISDRVHCLLVTLSYFRPDRFVQVLSLIPILILLLYLLVSIDLEYTGLLRVGPLEKATKF